MKIRLLISFFASMMLYTLLLLTATWPMLCTVWVQFICFIALTSILLGRYAKQPSQFACITGAVLAGRLMIELPLNVSIFLDNKYLLFVPLAVILAVCLTGLCFREKRYTVVILSMVLLVLFNTLVFHSWYKCFHHMS